jgi:hypothetical protein
VFLHSMDEWSDEVNIEYGAKLDKVEKDAEEKDHSAGVACHD